MSMPAFERDPQVVLSAVRIDQLMSYDRSGLPGIWTAVRHLVSVLLGAPGPVHAAYAAPDAASDTSTATNEFRKVNLADMCCLL
jgi:hypothetical protein